jgi:very-short-patch-repair endonuclease
MSALEEVLALQVRAMCLPVPEREYPAIPGRKFKFDFAWPTWKLLVEVQGGTWIKGGHSTGVGIARDCEKGCLAVVGGWRVLHVTRDQIEAGKAIRWIESILRSAA